jgi:4-diphosphocytidyl-2-C-methyl-D-erythritol kinase
LIVFPNCKINLGLHIIRKRADGYHDLETVFYPLPLKDALEVIEEPKTHQASPVVITNNPFTGELHRAGIRFSSSGLEITGKPEDNLCMKAWQIVKEKFPALPSANIHLHKSIPMGAGLGGGSSDGAFTLLLLNKKFQLALTTEQLLDFALKLGSDCPFFLVNLPCLATGRGEILEKISITLSGYSIVLINPGIYVDTKKAFLLVQPGPVEKTISTVIRQPIETWKEELKNDFEKAVFALYPQLQLIKEKLYQAGAIYAAMTGSGSCFYGIFSKGSEATPMLEEQYQVYHLKQSL